MGKPNDMSKSANDWDRESPKVHLLWGGKGSAARLHVFMKPSPLQQSAAEIFGADTKSHLPLSKQVRAVWWLMRDTAGVLLCNANKMH